MLQSPKKKEKTPLFQIPPPIIQGFSCTAVLLPLLFAFSPCRDNVYIPALAPAFCVIIPSPLVLYIFQVRPTHLAGPIVPSHVQ